MNKVEQSPLTTYLSRYDEAMWLAAVERLSPSMHEVDRDATRIWFAFWPLWLSNALLEAESIEKLVRELERSRLPAASIT